MRLFKRKKKMKMESPALVDLLNLANDMRRAKGDKTLDDLPDSYRGNPKSCLIARAFNYGCEVRPSGTNIYPGKIVFKTKEDRDTYVKVVDGAISYPEFDYQGMYCARLTPELDQIAIRFDRNMYQEYAVQ